VTLVVRPAAAADLEEAFLWYESPDSAKSSWRRSRKHSKPCSRILGSTELFTATRAVP